MQRIGRLPTASARRCRFRHWSALPFPSRRRTSRSGGRRSSTCSWPSCKRQRSGTTRFPARRTRGRSRSRSCSSPSNSLPARRFLPTLPTATTVQSTRTEYQSMPVYQSVLVSVPVTPGQVLLSLEDVQRLNLPFSMSQAVYDGAPEWPPPGLHLPRTDRPDQHSTSTTNRRLANHFVSGHQHSSSRHRDASHPGGYVVWRRDTPRRFFEWLPNVIPRNDRHRRWQRHRQACERDQWVLCSTLDKSRLGRRALDALLDPCQRPLFARPRRMDRPGQWR